MRYLLTMLVVWMMSTTSIAATRIEVDRLSDNLALGQYVDTVRLERDDSGLTDYVRNADFVAGEYEALNFGYTQQRVWLKFELSNASDHDIERILNIRYPLIDRLYLYNDSTTTPLYTLGRFYANEFDQALHIPASYFVMPLVIKAHSTETYYLSVDSDNSIALPIYLTTTPALERQAFQYAVNIVFYFGLVVTNILFAFFMTLLLRDREQLYYSLFMVSYHFLFFAVLEGMPHTLFGIDSLFISRDIIPYILSISMTIFTVFAASYLKLRKYAPKAYKMAKALTGIMLLSLVLCFILPSYYAIKLTTLTSILVGVFYASVVSNFILRGRPGVRSFLLAWGTGVAGAIVYGMKVWNLVPVNFITSYGWHIGTLIEAAVFSSMMAYRAARDRKERLEFLHQLNKKERDLRHTQERLLESESAAKADLELQVKQRTRDLSNILAQLETENRSLAELSINDGLTKVRNRRYFNDIFPQMWSDAIADQTPISVILLDIDHFKKVNDDYGHISGDDCLVKVAGIMRQSVNHPIDVVCRYGGEEFVIILPDTTQQQAFALAENMRKNIANTIISNNERAFRVTSSFGVGGLIPTEEIAPEDLIAQCDAALYTSKRNGRNRVTVADDIATSGKAEAADFTKL
ncbi:sensor domain-containing diguanylate cyclase [Thalassolituus oleivorans]|nr:sensor domain-containing diguanylate cyclase [Thalassolituus oleivorans]